MPDPLPATVFPEPVAVELLDGDSEPLRVDARGQLPKTPAWFRPSPGGGRRAVRSWAGPWPILQRWWDAAQSFRADRFQILDDDGDAWLLLGSDGSWWAEARYD
jgi:protein ImuB